MAKASITLFDQVVNIKLLIIPCQTVKIEFLQKIDTNNGKRRNIP